MSTMVVHGDCSLPACRIPQRTPTCQAEDVPNGKAELANCLCPTIGHFCPLRYLLCSIVAVSEAVQRQIGKGVPVV